MPRYFWEKLIQPLWQGVKDFSPNTWQKFEETRTLNCRKVWQRRNHQLIQFGYIQILNFLENYKIFQVFLFSVDIKVGTYLLPTTYKNLPRSLLRRSGILWYIPRTTPFYWTKQNYAKAVGIAIIIREIIKSITSLVWKLMTFEAFAISAPEWRGKA